jgi:XTP/dITP diphosphohydrolase
MIKEQIMSTKKPILLATSNAHKKAEFQKMLSHTNYTIIGLDDIGFNEEIEENHDTYKGNAMAKAEALTAIYDGIIIADDSGFEISAMDHAPGVYSARFQPTLSYPQKNKFILETIKDTDDRSCAFVCAIACFKDNMMWVTQQRAKGSVATHVVEGHGFGYDPIFVPLGYDESFSVLDPSIKNKISHRALAIASLLDYLDDSENH